MAIIQLSGFEMGASMSGEPAPISDAQFVTSPVRTGTYAGQINPTTTGVGYFEITTLDASTGQPINPTLGTAMYISFYLNYSTKPGSNNEEIFFANDGGSYYFIALRLNSTGTISVYTASGWGNTLVATGSTVLSSGTWYKISLKLDPIGTATDAYELKINDVSELTGSVNNNLQGTINALGMGKRFDHNAQSITANYDDMILSDTGFITGDNQVKVMIPDANGSTMTWTGGTGSSDYTQVDEIPFSDADYIQSPTSGNPNVGLMALTSTTTAGISGTIHALKGYIRTRENTSVTSATLIRVRSGSTNSDSSTRNGNTSYVQQMRILATDPDTGSAWTTSGLDAAEVGPVENNAVAVRCSSIGAMVAFTPATTQIKTVDGVARASVKTVNGVASASVKSITGLV